MTVSVKRQSVMIDRDRLCYFLSAKKIKCIFTMWRLNNKTTVQIVGCFWLPLRLVWHITMTEKLAFKPELITTQILKCFKNKYLTQFSSTTKRIKKCRSMTSGVKFYCICRLPYDAKWDTTQCDYCKLRTQKNQKLEKSYYEKLVLFTFCKQ